MSVENILMIIGFIIAAYAVVGNDAIQTLGTFLSSNSKRPWWVLWLFSSVIILGVVIYGLYVVGDISYGKFTGVFAKNGVDTYPKVFEWWYLIPPVVLLVITQFGIPVSTTFLIVSVFAPKAIDKMVGKSLMGFGIAFGIAIIVYFIVSKLVEKYFIETNKGQDPSPFWIVAQWLSTGFLWSQWLIQDMINIFVYLYKPLKENPESAPIYVLGGTAVLIIFQAILFYGRGGAIQKIVTTKTNTTDIRSATIIDFIYGLILLFIKGSIPLSTTWVFVGILAGRELALNYQLKTKSMSAVAKIVIMDLIKVFIGLAVSIGLVYLIRLLA